MKGSAGILLVALGLIMLYVILSDKYSCFTEFISCMTGADMRTPEGYTRGGPQPSTTTPPQPGFDPYKNNVFDLWNYIMK